MAYLLILILGGILSYFGPWWIIAPIAFGVCFWKAKDAKQAFLVASLACVTLWAGASTFFNVTAEVNLIDKIADLFTGGSGVLTKVPKVVFVFFIISLISSLVGGFSGLAGYNAKKYFKA